MSQIEIKNCTCIEDKEISRVSLTINQEIHAIIINARQSTLVYTLMGHPSYTVTEGELSLAKTF